MSQPKGGKSYLWFAAAGLALYCILLTVMTGDIGFDGDDWWVLACPYWNSFPGSIIEYGRDFLRPIEGVYWINLFEIFGFNKIAFHLCSLFLLAGSALLFGLCLDGAFPGRRVFVSTAVLLGFFLPTISCLTYVLFTDNSRLSMLLFWASVLAFQYWARNASPWTGLVLPILLYVASFLAYETSGFLIFAVPLLVWPIYCCCPDRMSRTRFLVRLGGAIFLAFALAVTIRFLFLSGGAVAHRHFFPPLELLWAYPAMLPFYLAAPFTSVSSDPWAWALGFMIVLWAIGLLYVLGRHGVREDRSPGTSQQSVGPGYLAALGLAVLFLGMLPYQLAGYGNSSPSLVDTLLAKIGLLPDGSLAWYDFNWASRIYSSASFGVAVLLALLVTLWQTRACRLVAKAVATIAIGFMAVFHAGLSPDWREAAAIRNDLALSLVSQIPEVSPRTNFVFLDLESYHGRAPIFRRWSGLREFVRMLYGDRTLGAWYLYPYSWEWPNIRFHEAIALPGGFVSRGMKLDKPAANDSLLLLRRSGRELVLLDKIGAGDGSVPTGILWKGATELTSNHRRIIFSEAITPQARLTRDAWSSGLIATLNLYKVRFTLGLLKKQTYFVLHDAFRRHLVKSRLFPLKSRL